MIEVFKTDMDCAEKARLLIEQLHQKFADYKANFDLNDCDNILRIVSRSGMIANTTLLKWLKQAGCNASVLPDH